MKKALALLLSVLMIFSAFGMTLAFAADDEIGEAVKCTVKFLNADKTLVEAVEVNYDEAPIAPENPTMENSVDKNGKEYQYIFKGWCAYDEKTGTTDTSKYYQRTTFDKVQADAAFIAVYSKQEVTENITFWGLVQSIFARINMIFEYFAKIFGGNKD